MMLVLACGGATRDEAKCVVGLPNLINLRINFDPALLRPVPKLLPIREFDEAYVILFRSQRASPAEWSFTAGGICDARGSILVLPMPMIVDKPYEAPVMVPIPGYVCATIFTFSGPEFSPGMAVATAITSKCVPVPASLDSLGFDQSLESVTSGAEWPEVVELNVDSQVTAAFLPSCIQSMLLRGINLCR